MSLAATCPAQELELEMLDPGCMPLWRLFKYPGGDWEEPDEIYRNERVDPPAGQKGAYSVLYMGNTLHGVAIECRLLRANIQDKYTWAADTANEYQVVQYSFSRPAIFLPIDGGNKRRLGLDPKNRAPGKRDAFQEAGLALFVRFGQVVHGLSWDSMHRDQPTRVYALWHDHKKTIGLARPAKQNYFKLPAHPDWRQFLADNPDVEATDAFTGTA